MIGFEHFSVELVSKKREEFNFNEHFRSIWMTHPKENYRKYFASSRQVSCATSPTPAMFPDVQMAYGTSEIIVYFVPSEDNNDGHKGS